VNFSQRHVVRALALDRLDDVGVLDTGLLSRTTGNNRDHVGISEALGDGGADICLAVTVFIAAL
jgi:hypothetical protein